MIHKFEKLDYRIQFYVSIIVFGGLFFFLSNYLMKDSFFNTALSRYFVHIGVSGLFITVLINLYRKSNSLLYTEGILDPLLFITKKAKYFKFMCSERFRIKTHDSIESYSQKGASNYLFFRIMMSGMIGVVLLILIGLIHIFKEHSMLLPFWNILLVIVSVFVLYRLFQILFINFHLLLVKKLLKQSIYDHLYKLEVVEEPKELIQFLNELKLERKLLRHKYVYVKEREVESTNKWFIQKKGLNQFNNLKMQINHIFLNGEPYTLFVIDDNMHSY